MKSLHIQSCFYVRPIVHGIHSCSKHIQYSVSILGVTFLRRPFKSIQKSPPKKVLDKIVFLNPDGAFTLPWIHFATLINIQMFTISMFCPPSIFPSYYFHHSPSPPSSAFSFLLPQRCKPPAQPSLHLFLLTIFLASVFSSSRNSFSSCQFSQLILDCWINCVESLVVTDT